MPFLLNNLSHKYWIDYVVDNNKDNVLPMILRTQAAHPLLSVSVLL